MKTIRMNISDDGSKVKIGVEGVAGEDCVKLTEGLEAAIFGEGSSTVEHTSEFYEDPEIGVTENV